MRSSNIHCRIMEIYIPKMLKFRLHFFFYKYNLNLFITFYRYQASGYGILCSYIINQSFLWVLLNCISIFLVWFVFFSTVQSLLSVWSVFLFFNPHREKKISTKKAKIRKISRNICHYTFLNSRPYVDFSPIAPQTQSPLTALGTPINPLSSFAYPPSSSFLAPPPPSCY